MAMIAGGVATPVLAYIGRQELRIRSLTRELVEEARHNQGMLANQVQLLMTMRRGE